MKKKKKCIYSLYPGFVEYEQNERKKVYLKRKG